MKNRLKQLRKQKNLTQNDVAELLSITNQAICLFEKGERTLKQENLQKLADFFEVSVPYLQGELCYFIYHGRIRGAWKDSRCNTIK